VSLIATLTIVRQPRLVLADSGVALTGEAGVEQRELPRGRGLLGDDAVSPADETDVIHDVAGLVDAGEPRADAELHVTEKGVLRHAEAHARRRRVAGADLDVDVAHRRIEAARVRVAHHLVARHDGRHGDGHRSDVVLIAPGEDDHRRHALLEARGVGGEQDHGSRGPDPKDAHAQGHHERARDPVRARRQEDDAMAGRVERLVEGYLQGVAVVGRAVADRLDRHRPRLGGSRRKDRTALGGGRDRRDQRRHREDADQGAAHVHSDLPLRSQSWPLKN
jgi:hypothetical protein